jgi:hypothetical protein
VNRPDGAGWVLAAAVRLLPPVCREWGTAMRAELVGIGPRPQRWRFTLGCVWVIVTRPVVWRRVGYPLLTLAVLAASLRGTARVWYAPLHWGLIGMVTTLVLVAWSGWGRPLGPVGAGLAARGVRAFGYLLVAVFAAKMVADMAAHVDNPGDQVPEVPVMTAVFVGYLLGVQASTARRSRASGRVLVAGLVAGGAAAVAWTATVVLAPPIPDDSTPAVVLMALGIVVAAVAAGGRNGAVGRLLAAACAGTVAALLIVDVVAVLTSFGSPWLIPDLVPVAPSPADDLTQSRIELVEPYLWLLLFGSLIALAQGVAALATRRPAAPATRLSDIRDVAVSGASQGPRPGHQRTPAPPPHS